VTCIHAGYAGCQVFILSLYRDPAGMDQSLEILSHLDRGPSGPGQGGPSPDKFLERDRLLEVLLANDRTNKSNGKHAGFSGKGKNKKRKILHTQLLNLYPGFSKF